MQWGINYRGWTGRTPQIYRWRVEAADRWMRQQGLIGVKRGRAEHWRAWWESLPGSASSRNVGRKALANYGEYMVTIGYRASNPADGIPTWRQPPSVPRALSAVESRRVAALAASQTSLGSVGVTLMLHCGLRIGECVALRWIDHDGEWLTVTGKGSKVRRVPTPDPVVSALRRWRVASLDPVWILPVSVNTLRRHVKTLAGHTPHSYRHSAATELLEVTGDLGLVQDFLGHASPATTRIYAQVRPDRLASSVQKMYAA